MKGCTQIEGTSPLAWLYCGFVEKGGDANEKSIFEASRKRTIQSGITRMGTGIWSISCWVSPVGVGNSGIARSSGIVARERFV